MVIFLFVFTILILFGLPALLLISACMGASRATRSEEIFLYKIENRASLSL
jgi:hypothetical protein